MERLIRGYTVGGVDAQTGEVNEIRCLDEDGNFLLAFWPVRNKNDESSNAVMVRMPERAVQSAAEGR